MNFVKFSVSDTNVFPMANSAAGGQLLSEFNIRSRESVGTPQMIKYMVGPSYTHSQEDFTISYETDSTGTILSRQHIQVAPGRALINGHFIESLAPAVIDLVAANAQIRSENRGLPSNNKKSLLEGELAIGLRMMYSTEMTTSGSLLVEDEDGMYMGIQIVILPKDEFFTPLDKPEDPNQFTAHLLLGTFKFVNNVISNIEQNTAKVQMLSADRIGDVGGVFSETYVTKTGLNPRHHYVFTTKHDSDNRDTWCEADDSLMEWDPHPIVGPNVDHTEQTGARFEYNNITKKTNLVLPHKQIDGPMTDTQGQPEYYGDKVLSLPIANYATGTGGVIDKTYTDNVKQVVEKLQRLYMLPNGNMRLYMDTLDDRSELPDLNKQPNWYPGDYILVGQDNTVTDELNAATPPATIYMIIPGKVKSVEWVAVNSKKPEITSEDSEWKAMISSILGSIDWRRTIREELSKSDNINVHTADWNNVINNKIREVTFLGNTHWDEVIHNAIEAYKYQKEQGAFDSWQSVIAEGWEKAYTQYIESRNTALEQAEQRKETALAIKREKEAALVAAQQVLDGANTRSAAYETAKTNYNNAAKDLAALKRQWDVFTKSEFDYRVNGNTYEVTIPATGVKFSYKDADGTIVKNNILTEDGGTWYSLNHENKTTFEKLTQLDGLHPLSESNATSQIGTYEQLVQQANAELQDAREIMNSGISVSDAEAAVATATEVSQHFTTAWQNAVYEYNNCKEAVDLANEIFNEGRYFPAADLAQSIQNSIDIQGIDWTEFIVSALAKGISDTSEIEWDEIISNEYNNQADGNIADMPWDTIIPNAVVNYIKHNNIVDNYLNDYIPPSLLGGIELGRVDSDKLDYQSYDEVLELLGLTQDGQLVEDRPRGRIGVDYYRVIYTNEDGEVFHTFYAVSEAENKEYINPPMRITADVPYAQEDVVGGFLNVPETQIGSGYVYRNEYGYLQLLDYDLLASGVLAYQLGEDFNCPAGLASSEIQANLDEYVNTRVAFPNANQLANSSTPYIIHIYINLSREDTGYEISLNNIDSRFGTAVYVHVSGEADSSCILNVIKCQKLRLDINVLGGLTVNLTDTELYYDPGTLDKIEFISGLKLWYDRFTSDDPDILVQNNSVEFTGTPTKISNEEYWRVDSPNDNHYSYGLKGITLDSKGKIVGAKLLVTDDITGNVDDGSFISTFEFKFPQSIGLSYPATKLSKSIKITGEFVTAYPLQNQYLLKDNKFTARTYSKDEASTLSGLISFKTDISHVARVYGITGEEDSTQNILLPHLDTWETGEFHIFEGGTVD